MSYMDSCEQKPYNTTSVQEFVQESLLPGIGINKTISISTAQQWLNIPGYHYQQQKQGIYYDGHEREDVVEYRHIFLLEIAKFEKYMATYEGEDMKRIAPILNLGEKKHILVVHDECIFYSNVEHGPNQVSYHCTKK